MVEGKGISFLVLKRKCCCKAIAR